MTAGVDPRTIAGIQGEQSGPSVTTNYTISGDDWRSEAAVIVARSLEGEQVRVVAQNGQVLALVGTAGVGGMLEEHVRAAAAGSSSLGSRPIAGSERAEFVSTPVELGADWRE